MILQLGLSLIMPVLLCVAACWWLCSAFGFGSWIYVIGILFGLVSSGVSAWKFYVAVMKRQGRPVGRKEKKTSGKPEPTRTAFNDHA